MYSKIIKNGTIIDGTGKPVFKADIAIEQDRIVQIGNLQKANAEEIYDATGKYISPGFIDIQNHSDVYWTIFDSPSLDSLVAQGITTAIIGNCGASLAPLLSRDALLSIQKWHNLEGVNFNWLTFDEYLNELSKRNFGVNIGSLVGYSTLRRGLVKDEIRPLQPEEMVILIKALEHSLKAGAFGLSSGLSYAHEATIASDELLTLSETLKKHHAMLAVHLRSEGAELLESINEALDLASKTGVNLKISHLKVRNKENWHLFDDALHSIETAYQKGSNVHFDVYPYDFVWQVLYTYLPKWSYEGGREAMMRHLKDPIQRNKVKAYLQGKNIDYAAIFIASTTMSLNVNGKTLSEIAERQGVGVEEALLNIVERGGSEILVFERNLEQKQVNELLSHALGMIATDGAGFPIKGRESLVHPRCFGSMPKFLCLVLKEKLCSIEQAIQKMTSIPASKIGLKHRGVLAVDNYADIVVFDESINSKASFSNPFQQPTGIDLVLVNGRKALVNGELTQKLNGRVLRKHS
ncbi:MAG: amidohydrolase family protein [Patescibacteria group bacterium]